MFLSCVHELFKRQCHQRVFQIAKVSIFRIQMVHIISNLLYKTGQIPRNTNVLMFFNFMIPQIKSQKQTVGGGLGDYGMLCFPHCCFLVAWCKK